MQDYQSERRMASASGERDRHGRRRCLPSDRASELLRKESLLRDEHCLKMKTARATELKQMFLTAKYQRTYRLINTKKSVTRFMIPHVNRPNAESQELALKCRSLLQH